MLSILATSGSIKPVIIKQVSVWDEKLALLFEYLVHEYLGSQLYIIQIFEGYFKYVFSLVILFVLQNKLTPAGNN